MPAPTSRRFTPYPRSLNAELAFRAPRTLPLDEEAIERYVRYPHTLTEDERLYSERLIAHQPAARELAIFFAQFYAEYDELMATSTPPAA